MERRAILLQNVAGFIAELQPQYSDTLAMYIPRRPELEQEFLQWMARKIIEEVYSLFDRNFNKNEPLYGAMFQHLADALPFSIEKCFGHYVEAPHIYPDNLVVEIRIVGKSILTIDFTTDVLTYRTR